MSFCFEAGVGVDFLFQCDKILGSWRVESKQKKEALFHGHSLNSALDSVIKTRQVMINFVGGKIYDDGLVEAGKILGEVSVKSLPKDDDTSDDDEVEVIQIIPAVTVNVSDKTKVDLDNILLKSMEEAVTGGRYNKVGLANRVGVEIQASVQKMIEDSKVSPSRHPLIRLSCNL